MKSNRNKFYSGTRNSLFNSLRYRHLEHTQHSASVPVPSTRSEQSLHYTGTSYPTWIGSKPGHFHSIPFPEVPPLLGIGNKTAIYCRYMSTAASSPVTIVIIFIPYGTSLRQLFHLFVFGERIFFACFVPRCWNEEADGSLRWWRRRSRCCTRWNNTKMGALAGSYYLYRRALEGYLWTRGRPTKRPWLPNGMMMVLVDADAWLAFGAVFKVMIILCYCVSIVFSFFLFFVRCSVIFHCPRNKFSWAICVSHWVKCGLRLYSMYLLRLLIFSI